MTLFPEVRNNLLYLRGTDFEGINKYDATQLAKELLTASGEITLTKLGLKRLPKSVVPEYGNKYGRLRILDFNGINKSSKRAEWIARCDCGNTKVVTGDGVRSGRIKSCGCYRQELINNIGNVNKLSEVEAINRTTQSRLCKECRKLQPSHLFYKPTTHICKPCVWLGLKKWGEANPNRRKIANENGRRLKILRDYGITEQEYADLLHRQNGKCAICKERPAKTFHIDHDHKTGEVRGLLCGNCNFMLGLGKDNPEVFIEASKYLQCHRTP